MGFLEVDKKYRPVPFWSWNERLDVSETKKQIDMMEKAGMGGFFMHARGGLQTEYMEKEWFENVSVSIDEAKKQGMYAWAYDENGWPSGFGNGIVTGVGEEFQQKYLLMETEEIHVDSMIYQEEGLYFYYEVNPFYSDNLNAEAVKMFVREIYLPYYEKYQNSLEGFFTDEPQLYSEGIPWSHVLPNAYMEEYGEDLLPHLKELFFEVGDYKKTRIRFWRLVTLLFSKNFMKVIYDFCEEHNLKLTGHLLGETTLRSQLACNGACMPHYEYLHIPGIDWLGRDVYDCLASYQVSSVAQQLGRKQVLVEAFALSGHNVSFDELKGIFEWHMVRGITLLCQHLEGYSLRGVRKRDYPPAMYYQQPWWDEYRTFNDGVSRIGMVLSEGCVECDVLVIHPQTSAWAVFDDEKKLEQLNEKILNVIKTLEQKHITFHLGDEILLERHGSVSGDALTLGNYHYKKVIMSHCENLLDHTKELLEQFAQNGGQIVEATELPDNPICVKEITYTKRVTENYTAHYFVNSNIEAITSKIAVQGQILDIITGELYPFDGEHYFEPFGSLIIIENGSKNVVSQKKENNCLDLSGEWEITERSENVLTLDFCDYYFDGELQEKNGYVLNIANRANDLQRKIQLHQDYQVSITCVPEILYLVCETPESFEIKVNGTVIDKTDCGYFRDISFRKLDISKYVKVGNNIISFDCDFMQSKEVYENLDKATKFQSEKNKLVYDMEIEAIYLVGDFSVATEGYFKEMDRNAMRYIGGFSIDRPKKFCELSHIEQQGFPFFVGKLSLAKNMELSHTNYTLKYRKMGVNIIKVKVNGKELKPVLWGNKVELSEYLHVGNNQIEITLINNLRNMLGPLHLEIGESYRVTPALFFEEECVWSGWSPDDKTFNKNYCFVSFGLEHMKSDEYI